MGKTIGLTYDLKSDWPVGPNDPIDANAEYDSIVTVERLAKAFESGGHRVKKIGNVKRLLEQVNGLDVDIIFNICEGFGGRGRESQVPMLLELNGIPCVGSDSLSQGVSLDKVITKKILIADGIPTPKFFVATLNDDLKKLNTIGFPLIVKTRFEGTSKGLTENSLVESQEDLKRQVEIINKQYRQSALVEEFVKGEEFTVAVLGNENPKAMPVVQVCIDGKTHLGNQFFTFARVSDKNLTYQCPAKISDKLAKHMQDLAIKTYQSIECRDFGRVDFRVDDKGNAYVLEINPLPSLAEVDVFNVFPQAMGSTYDKILNEILNFAFKRYGIDDGKSSLQSSAPKHAMKIK